MKRVSKNTMLVVGLIAVMVIALYLYKNSLNYLMSEGFGFISSYGNQQTINNSVGSNNSLADQDKTILIAVLVGALVLGLLILFLLYR